MKATDSAKKPRKKPIIIGEGNVVVKIYTRTKTVNGAEYRVFEVADFTAGRRVLHSFSDREKAEKEAERIKNALESGQVRVAQMRAPEAASYGRAVELLKPTGIALEIAAGRVAEAVKILGSDRIIEAAKYLVAHDPDKLTRRTVKEAVDELLASKEGKGASDRYIQDLRSRLTRFADSFAVDIHTVTTAEIQRWFDELKVSAQTLKNFRTVLGTLFSFAEARGYITRGSNPIAGTERVSGKNGDSVEIFTPQEITRLLNAASKEFRPCLALGAFAGLRSAEIERLEWSDIDLADGHITVAADKAKTASRRLVPIAPNLKQWLAPYARKSGLVWKGSHEDFYDAQQQSALATEVKADSAKGIKGEKAVKWKANGLRHSYISYRLADIQDAAKVAMEAGNSPSVVFGHYRELVKPKAAKEWFAVSPKQPKNVVTMEVVNE